MYERHAAAVLGIHGERETHERAALTAEEEVMRRTCAYVLSLVVAAAQFTGCATTEVTSVWKDESYQGKPRKVLVNAIVKQQRNRRIIEDEFVAHFRSRGIDAVPSYVIFPGEEPVKKEVMDEKLKAQGFDTLLLTHLTGSKREQVQVPGTVTYQPMYPGMYQPAPYYHTWPGYYNTGYTATYSPSYMAEQEYVMAEANLYDVATEKLIWTAATETMLGQKDQKMIKNYVAVIMDAMRKQKVVP
jgi:hypothetical protein